MLSWCKIQGSVTDGLGHGSLKSIKNHHHHQHHWHIYPGAHVWSHCILLRFHNWYEDGKDHDDHHHHHHQHFHHHHHHKRLLRFGAVKSWVAELIICTRKVHHDIIMMIVWANNWRKRWILIFNDHGDNYAVDNHMKDEENIKRQSRVAKLIFASGKGGHRPWYNCHQEDRWL